MRELSVFVDESGDFGEYEKHAPYYIITMVLHDQSVDISAEIEKLNGTCSIKQCLLSFLVEVFLGGRI